ncbi:MAG TPA: CBS domain-containing protein [Candidatus Eisenbacteria bacterium]
MRVQDLMTWDPESCTAHHDLAHAAMIMWRRDCGIVPVVEGGTNKLIGVITDRDICMATATKGRSPAAITVGDVMSKEPTTCLPGDDLKTALRKMSDSQVRRLPVADTQGYLRGIVGLNDLILHAEKTDRHGEAPVTYTDVVGVLRAVCKHRAETAITTAR